jgi:uncharacterized membrane protein
MSTLTNVRQLVTLLVWGVLAFLVVAVLYLLIGLVLFGAGHEERGTDVQKIHVVKEKK